MKYEAVFGDQSLFDGAPEEATHATKGGGFYNIENMSVKYVSDGIFNGTDVLSVGGYLIAERRIIAEPKRWTRADKDAGRSPVYGAILESNGGNRVKFLAENNRGLFHCQYDDGSICAYLPKFFKPIETPAEKAQREEDEWVNKAWSETAVFAGVAQDEHDRLRIHLRHIYKAQFSGELQAPKGGE